MGPLIIPGSSLTKTPSFIYFKEKKYLSTESSVTSVNSVSKYYEFEVVQSLLKMHSSQQTTVSSLLTFHSVTSLPESSLGEKDHDCHLRQKDFDKCMKR